MSVVLNKVAVGKDIDIDPEASTVDWWLKPLLAYGVPAVSFGTLGALIDKKNRVRGGLLGLLFGGAAGGGIHYAYNKNLWGMGGKIDRVLGGLALRFGKETDAVRDARLGTLEAAQAAKDYADKEKGTYPGYDTVSKVLTAAKTGKDFWALSGGIFSPEFYAPKGALSPWEALGSK